MIEAVRPSVDGGRFAAKRTVGETVAVEADIFADGHDKLRAVLQVAPAGSDEWHETELEPLPNDLWRGTLVPGHVGLWRFRIEAWIDPYGSWRHATSKKLDAGQDVDVDLLHGAELLEGAAQQAPEDAARALRAAGRVVADRDENQAARFRAATEAEIARLIARYAPRRHAARTERPLELRVDRERARFSTWYELFPRSASADPDRPGTFADVTTLVPRIAALGFDVLYLPPVHPIGRAFRKGPNNTLDAGPDDPGSPWAIGAADGGHDALHPELGTEADFEALVRTGHDHGIEIALDLAFQCSPDHPWVTEHPTWFRHRADGSIQYAENPPKKYQDIYPIDFESEDWEALWCALRDVTLHWVERGVRIFRVDNPHTKAFRFWEWVIAEVKSFDPDVLFLSEAFTRPKPMYRLAKLGFTQSYTYFAWRHDPHQLREYYEELTQSPVVDFFRPNAWPNTPDILTESLQHGGRPTLAARLVLAATLSASYGVYGPPYEWADVRPQKPDSEEYLDSEKYQRRSWPFDRPGPLTALMRRINRIRRAHPALQQDRTLVFHGTDNGAVALYSKSDPASGEVVIVAVSTDPYHEQWAHTDLDLGALDVGDDEPFEVHDLLTDQRFQWRGHRNVVGLDPHALPAHVFVVRRSVRPKSQDERA